GAVAAVGPLGGAERCEHPVILVDIAQPGFCQTRQSRGMVVLLAGIDARTTRIASPQIENQRRAECVGPGAAIVPALRSARRRRNLSDRSKCCNPVLGVSEEQAVLL